MLSMIFIQPEFLPQFFSLLGLCLLAVQQTVGNKYMSVDQISRYIPDTTIGIIGGSSSIVLGNVNIVAGIVVAFVSTVVLVLRYLDHRKKHRLEIMKLEEDLRRLRRLRDIEPED